MHTRVIYRAADRVKFTSAPASDLSAAGALVACGRHHSMAVAVGRNLSFDAHEEHLPASVREGASKDKLQLIRRGASN